MTEIERKGRKIRRHLSLSREFDGAADELLPDYVEFSTWAERVLWKKLIEEYGEEAVLEAVGTVQADMEDDELLAPNQREQYELPA